MNATFESWELQTRFALAQQNVNHHAADPLIEDARAHWEASGTDPWQALGEPKAFADAAAAEQPPDQKAAVDREGQEPGDYLSGIVFVLAVLLIPWSIVAAIVYSSWSFALTPARLVGSALFVLVFFCLFALPDALRAAGYPRRAPWAYLPTLLLMPLTVVAFTSLPKTGWVTIPVLAFDVAAAIIALLQLGPAKPARSPSGGTGPEGTESWLARLDGLLIGRHDLPPARAAELVAEARAHLGTESPGAEFGAPEIYAAELAQHETTRQIPWWHQKAVRNSLFLVFIAVLNRDRLMEITGTEDGLDGNLLWQIPTGVGLVLLAVALFMRVGARQYAKARRRKDADHPGTGLAEN